MAIVMNRQIKKYRNSYTAAVIAKSISNTVALYIMNELESFKLLDEGWCYGEGGPIEDRVVKSAMQIVVLGHRFGQSVSVFPGTDGSIELRFHGEVHQTLVVTVETDGIIGASLQIGYGFEYEVAYDEDEVSVETLKTLLNCIPVEIEWPSLVSSIRGTTYMTTAGTQVRRSAYRTMAQERRYSILSALKPEQEEYAVT